MATPLATDYRISHLQRLLAGQYRFEKELGQGGAATVYLAVNLRLNRFEALKVLGGSQPHDPEYTRRFAQEVQLAAAIDHPHIIKVYDSGIADGIFWYSMQYIHGYTLDRLLLERGLLSPSAVAAIAIPVLDALQSIHQMQIVHRDVKPANIILDSACRPYLMDFGIARPASSLKKTQTGIMLGTPAYLSPEQASGTGPDGRSDIYSLGVTCYELLTGRLPFPAETSIQAIFSRLKEDPVPLLDLLPELDPDLHRIIMRALARDREKRFATAADMRDALLAGGRANGEPQGPGVEPGLAVWLAGRLTLPAGSTLPAPPRGKPWRWLPPFPSGKWRWIQAAALLVLIGSTAAWLNFPARPDQPAPAVTERQGLPAGNPASTPPPPSGPAGPDPSPARSNPAIGPAGSAGQPPAPAPAGPPAEKQPAGSSRPAAAPPEEILVRRAVRPAEFVEKAPVVLPEGVATECRGKRIGVSVTIGEDGLVKNARLLSVVPAACGEAALAAVRKYIYRPAQDARGEPVESTMAVSIELE